MTQLANFGASDSTVLSVGVLGADLLHLGDDLDRLEGADVQMVHVDVMDGVFCPQMTVGPPFVAALPADRFVIDVHLMIDDPLAKVDSFVDAGAGIVTIHAESTEEPGAVLSHLGGREVVRGLALNPDTPVAVLKPLLDELELVLVLAVHPGRGGQSFAAGTKARFSAVRDLIGQRDIAVGVDGGVTRQNVEHVASFGADVIVAGSAVFSGADISDNARFMLEATGSARPAGASPMSFEPAAYPTKEEFDG